MRYNGTIDYFTVDKQGRLDFLWVSLDGSSPETYADVRLGNELPRILENLKRLRRMKYHYPGQTPRLGIAFVLMKRNASALQHVVRLAFQLGAEEIMVTKVLPYSEEKKEEILYTRSMSMYQPRARLFEFDFSPCTVCNSCEYLESNVEDCFGSKSPAYGGCLWAQSFIQCP